MWVAIIVAVVVGGGAWWWFGTVGPQAPGWGTTDQEVSDASSATSSDAGSVKPDVRVVVGESIQGKWQSTDDSKFVREFKADGTVADSYSGAVQSTGTYKTFIKADAPAGISIPLKDNAVYIAITTNGQRQDYQVLSLGTDTLQLMYLEGSGVQNFTLIK
jgi:hypothetical protein